MQPERASDDSSVWVPATLRGDLDWILGFQFDLGPAIAGVGIWEENQRMEELCLSLCLLKETTNQKEVSC